MRHRKWFLAPLALLLAAALPAGADDLVYAGTFTNNNNGSRGIYVYRFQPANGKVKPLGVAAETANPSFLVTDATHRFLYAVNENSGPGVLGSVSAFSIDHKTGKLTLLNWVSSRGGGPCHLALDRTGRWLAVANYATGSIAVIPVHADGRLGEAVAFRQHEGKSVNPARQQGPHAHCVLFSPDNRFLLVADLGLDKILVYRFDASNGSIAPNKPAFAGVKPGSGVRHLVFHPNGKVLYAISEMGNSISAYNYYAQSGTLDEFQTIGTLTESFHGASTAAEIAINQAGTVLYASNRGDNSIAEYAVDPTKFTLTLADHFPTLGKTPRHFALDPSGSWLFAANQDSNDIVVFKVYARTGQLTPDGTVLKDAPSPVCILFVPE